MLKFHGSIFYAISDWFGTLSGGLQTMNLLAEQMQSIVPGVESYRLNLSSIETLAKSLKQFRTVLESADLQLSLDSYDRLQRLVDTENPGLPAVNELVAELQGRIRDELSHFELWLVTKAESRFLKINPFGEDIPNKFDPARDDIEEAGKCLAYGRGTACVFHLMRVMEVGLRALAASLNDPRLDPKRNPSWDSILKKCDEELLRPLHSRCDEWRQDDGFYSTASAQLHAVKDAWRNPTMHVERNYTPEEAEDVWNAVRAFMRHLSQKLSA
jgi:hypothetical protein